MNNFVSVMIDLLASTYRMRYKKEG